MMTISAFDTLATTRSMEAAGMPRAHAESITDALRQAMDAQASVLATKDDVATLRADMTAQMTAHREDTTTRLTALHEEIVTLRAETKADLSAFRAEMFRMMWLQLAGMVTAVGALLTVFRVF